MQIPEYYPTWLKSLSEKEINTEKENLTNLLDLINQKLSIISQAEVIKSIEKDEKVKQKIKK